MPVPSQPGRPFLRGTDPANNDSRIESDSRGPDFFQLKWTPSTDAQNYLVDVKGNGFSTTVNVADAQADISGLPTNTLLTVSVTAVNAGDSSVSPVRQVFTRPPAPQKPYLVGTNPGSTDPRPSHPQNDEPASRRTTELRFTWNVVPGATGYEAQVQGEPGPRLIGPGDPIDSLQPNTLFSVEVRTVAAGGRSFASPSRNAYTRPKSPPKPFLTGTTFNSPQADDPLAELPSRGPTYLGLSLVDQGGIEAFEFEVLGQPIRVSATALVQVGGLLENVSYNARGRVDDQDRGGRSFWSAVRTYTTRPPTVPGFRRKDFAPIPRGITLEWNGVAEFHDVDDAIIVVYRRANANEIAVFDTGTRDVRVGSYGFDLTLPTQGTVVHFARCRVGLNRSFPSSVITTDCAAVPMHRAANVYIGHDSVVPGFSLLYDPEDPDKTPGGPKRDPPKDGPNDKPPDPPTNPQPSDPPQNDPQQGNQQNQPLDLNASGNTPSDPKDKTPVKSGDRVGAETGDSDTQQKPEKNVKKTTDDTSATASEAKEKGQSKGTSRGSGQTSSGSSSIESQTNGGAGTSPATSPTEQADTTSNTTPSDSNTPGSTGGMVPGTDTSTTTKTPNGEIQSTFSQSKGGSPRCTVEFPGGKLSVNAPADGKMMCKSGYESDPATGKSVSTIEVEVRRANGDKTTVAVGFDASGNKVVVYSETRVGVTTTAAAKFDQKGKVVDSSFNRTPPEMSGNAELRSPKAGGPANPSGETRIQLDIHSSADSKQGRASPEKQQSSPGDEKSTSTRSPEKAGTTTVAKTEDSQGAGTTTNHKGNAKLETTSAQSPEKRTNDDNNTIIIIGERKKPHRRDPPEPTSPPDLTPPMATGQVGGDFITDLLFDTLLTLGIAPIVRLAVGGMSAGAGALAGAIKKTARGTPEELIPVVKEYFGKEVYEELVEKYVGKEFQVRFANNGDDLLLTSKDGTGKIHFDLVGTYPHANPHLDASVLKDGKLISEKIYSSGVKDMDKYIIKQKPEDIWLARRLGWKD